MDSPEIVVLLGTRPEVIKLAPVVLALREAGLRCFVLASGQHRELLAGALSSFGLSADRDLALMRNDQPLNELVARLVEGLGRALDEIKPRLVIVQGDTATALAGALAAMHHKLPCAHVEAGLRSGRRDAPWPEELYRQMVDRLCTRLYAPTEGARQHLLREGLDASSIVVTGQTGVDAALLAARQTRVKPAGFPALPPGAKLIYATAHRRESFGKLAGMVGALAEIVEERADVEVILPLHPNPEVRRQAAPFVGRHPRLHLIEPVDYADSVWLLTRAALCVTDSGGIQEEAPSFGLPVLVMREVTERPEGIAAGFLRVIGTDGGTIAREIRRTLDDTALRRKLSRTANPYGDGKAALRIAADIKRALRTERRASAGLAPDPASTPEPVVQVYGARCSRWRGYFGIHTWIAVKPAGARAYTIYEVIDSYFRRTGSAVAIRKRAPDARWFGNTPELLGEKRGDGVDALIARIEKAAREYPYAHEYVVWPGPNSNTFTAHVARAVPELEVDLPPTAIGKDYLGGKLMAAAPSGSGFQLSLFGMLGVLASGAEGFEVNVLGLSFGLDPFSPALRLPLVGRLGAARSNGSGAPVSITADPS